ncbi:MAG: hypothetical protein HQK60_16655, partial [Deltaproteobacteria bacterium]|nr:hypothetical protein [Deltaproteobacteria bacterium]
MSGKITGWDLWHQHNESRIVFPRLVFWGLARLTRWDVRYETILTFVLACLVSWGVYRLGRTTVTNTRTALWLTCLANLLIFSPVQSQNWLWGIEMVMLTPVVCLVAGLVVCYTARPVAVKYLACLIIATVATYSYANGMVCWVLMLPVLILTGTGPRNRTAIWVVVYIMGLAANLTLYFWGYQHLGHHPGLGTAWHHPVQAVTYFLAFLGAP